MVESFFEHDILYPGPHFALDLAPLDARHPIHYSRRLLIFRCASSAQRAAQLAALNTSLEALVQQCPILAGTVVALPTEEAKDGKEDWRTIVPGDRLQLIVRDLRSKIASFEELSAASLPLTSLPYDLLVPVPLDIGNDRPYPACKIQYSAIDGGSILTWAMSHSVADGSGNNELMRILSELTRSAQQGATHSDILHTKEILGLDRSILRNISSEKEFNIDDHPAFTDRACSLTIEAEAFSQHFKASQAEVPVLIGIPSDRLLQLKKDATLPGAPSISTHDAISSLVWRSVLFIRSRRRPSASTQIPPSASTTLFMPSDCRRHTGLPSAYIGNAVYQLAASLPLTTLLSPTGLQHAATAIRGAITAVDAGTVASYMVRLKDQWVDWGFLRATDSIDVAMGTDWTSGTIYGDDWGEAFGPVVRYRYPGEGMNCIMPKLANGSAEVVVAVMPEEIGTLRGEECFGAYQSSDERQTWE